MVCVFLEDWFATVCDMYRKAGCNDYLSMPKDPPWKNSPDTKISYKKWDLLKRTQKDGEETICHYLIKYEIYL